MADIRINALATTAASTASDDFVAVDGSANGTRKLNAYSPTFGGNLTVSGTGTSAFGGLVKATGNAATSFGVEIANGAGFSGTAQYYLTAGTGAGFTAFRFLRGNGAAGYEDNGFNADCWAGARFNLNALGGSGGNFTISGGNLTVSGTGVFGSSSGATAAQLNAWNDQAAPTRLLVSNQTNNASSLVGIDFEAYGGGWQVDVPRSTTFVNPLVFKFNSSEQARFTSGGTLLLKTDGIDSSNGKLQLATHTTSAGGIGFGTDVSLYRESSVKLTANSTGSSLTLALAVGGTQKAIIASDGTTAYLGATAAGGSTILYSGNAATALTLDSSQNATFAGTVKVNGQGIIKSVVGISVGTTATTILTISGTAGANFCFVCGDNGSHGFADLVVTIGGGNAVTVISSATLYGSPAARTYTTTGTSLQLALASGTLSIRTTAIYTA